MKIKSCFIVCILILYPYVTFADKLAYSHIKPTKSQTNEPKQETKVQIVREPANNAFDDVYFTGKSHGYKIRVFLCKKQFSWFCDNN